MLLSLRHQHRKVPVVPCTGVRPSIAAQPGGVQIIRQPRPIRLGLPDHATRHLMLGRGMRSPLCSTFMPFVFSRSVLAAAVGSDALTSVYGQPRRHWRQAGYCRRYDGAALIGTA
jgi:hypothetical protein